MENDYGAFFNKNDDKYFSHGTKLSTIKRSTVSAVPRSETASLGQNIYTPSKKRTDALKSDLDSSRPYTGWLYLEYRRAQLENRIKSVYGVQAGCSGRCSYAKETQTFIHEALGQSVPTWDRNYSLKSEPGVILEWEQYYELVRTDFHYVDVYYRSKFGNIINSGGIGLSFKYGQGTTDFDPEEITFKKTLNESLWTYYFFGSVEGRGVPYNHFLDGSLFQSERHTVDSNFFVGEANLGFRVGYKNFKTSYNYTVFTDEWDGQNGPFFFAGLDFSW